MNKVKLFHKKFKKQVINFLNGIDKNYINKFKKKRIASKININ